MNEPTNSGCNEDKSRTDIKSQADEDELYHTVTEITDSQEVECRVRDHFERFMTESDNMLSESYKVCSKYICIISNDG